MSLSSPIPPSTRHRPASRPRCCQSPRSRCCSKQNLERSLHRNQQFSITAITDGGGGISERYAYSAYGTPTITDASGTTRTTTAIGNRYMYTGREWDESLALYHYRARMYDSVGGRFVSRDPIGFDGSRYSLYGYVSGHPLTGVDPSGLLDATAGMVCRVVVKRVPHVRVFCHGVSVGNCIAEVCELETYYIDVAYWICDSESEPTEPVDTDGEETDSDDDGKCDCVCAPNKWNEPTPPLEEWVSYGMMTPKECSSLGSIITRKCQCADGQLPPDYDPPPPPFE
jgi:RHS repeat-associated protein